MKDGRLHENLDHVTPKKAGEFDPFNLSEIKNKTISEQQKQKQITNNKQQQRNRRTTEVLENDVRKNSLRENKLEVSTNIDYSLLGAKPPSEQLMVKKSKKSLSEQKS